MAQYITSETRYFDQILSTTYDYYRATLVDNIFKMNALFYKMYKGGQIAYQDGGASLIFPIMYGKNDTVAWYEDDEDIDVQVQEGIGAAKMKWCQLAGSISFTRKQRRMNSGRHQIINLISAKLKQAEMSMHEKMNDAFYEAGAYNESQTSKQICGLEALVAETPDSYDVGGIDTSVQTFWQNKVRGNANTAFTWIDDSDAPSLATGPVAMRELYTWCSKGTGGPPNFGFAGIYGYLSYEAYMSTRQIYRDPEMAKMGFDNIKFRNMTLFYDEATKSENITNAETQADHALMFFLNTDFLHLKVDSQTDFVRTDFQRPVNQDSEAALILWMGNMCTSKRSKHGVLADHNDTNVT